MSTFHQKLHEWLVSETNLLSEGHLKLFPDPPVLCRLIVGKHKKIWKYVVEHVRSCHAADKVRRVLAVKQSHPELENPYSINDINEVQNKLSKAEERRSYLKGTQSVQKRRLASSEIKLQRLRNKTCTIDHKTVLLKSRILECRRKCADFNSIKSQLSFHMERNSKTNSQFYLSINCSRTAKSVSSNKVNFARDTDTVNYILRQISSLHTDFNSYEISESFNQKLKKRLDQMISSITLPDLFIILKEISHTSYMRLLSKETCSSAKVQTVKTEMQNSVKCVQDMKLEIIQSGFNIKKTQKEIGKLLEIRTLLLKKCISNAEIVEFKEKFNLFEKMAENAGLRESIKFLEDSLREEQHKAKMLKKGIEENPSKSNNIELAVRNFIVDLHKYRNLLKSCSCGNESILKFLSNLHKFANEQMFSPITCTLKEYPFQMKADLKLDNQKMWYVLARNNVVNSLVPTLFSVSPSVPDALTRMLDLYKFHSECVIIHKVKKLKEESNADPDSEFEFDDSVLPQARQQYIFMTEALQKMLNKLELCSGNILEGTEQCKRVNVVVEDWWKQSAQFIPEIEYEGKTLKMWLDILHAIPNF